MENKINSSNCTETSNEPNLNTPRKLYVDDYEEGLCCPNCNTRLIWIGDNQAVPSVCKYCGQKIDNGQDQSNDLVNHPSHYNSGKIECIDALDSMISKWEDPVAATLAWQVVKYIWRHPFKENPVQDLLKAEFYLNRLIAHVKEETCKW